MSEAGQTLPRGQFGPVLVGGRERHGGPDWRLLGKTVAFLLIGTLLVGTLAVGGLIVYTNGQIGRIQGPMAVLEPEADASQAADEDEVVDVLNVLLVGSDTRDGLTRQQLLELGTEATNSHLTDTVILLQIDPRRDQAAMLSFPRDLYIRRCDGSMGKLNAAYVVGEQAREGQGPACLVETIEDFARIPIDHYVEVNLAGFIDVVDALGGVSMYLEEPIRDRAAGLDLPAGCVTLSGTQALSFVRARTLDNDFGRIARQQRFAREVVREATSAGILLNPPRLVELIDAVGNALRADRRLSVLKMKQIAQSLRGFNAAALETRTVPGAIKRVGGQSVVVADEEEAERLFTAFRGGDEIPTEIGTSAPTAVDAADVPPVTVLNGAGIAGIAAAAAERLEAAGLEVAETGNAERFDFRRTQVIYPPDSESEAEIVATVFPGAALVPGDRGTSLSVVVGQDFDPSAAPSTGPSPSPTRRRAAATEPAAPPTPSYRGAEPSAVEC